MHWQLGWLRPKTTKLWWFNFFFYNNFKVFQLIFSSFHTIFKTCLISLVLHLNISSCFSHFYQWLYIKWKVGSQVLSTHHYEWFMTHYVHLSGYSMNNWFKPCSGFQNLIKITGLKNFSPKLEFTWRQQSKTGMRLLLTNTE